MKAIITDKQSVAKDIARILNVNEKRDGYLFSDTYYITWTLGHLVSFALPSDYGYSRLVPTELPILPDPLTLFIRKKQTEKGYITDNVAYKQLKIIEKIINQSDSIIVATDSSAEGELIFRNVYDFLNCKTPFKRLWTNSMTDDAILRELNNLKSGMYYNNLYKAADCRAKADWLIGTNASQAFCFVCGMGNNSLGRVETPTLSMICSRYLENKHLNPESYWQLKVSVERDDLIYHFTSAKDIRSKNEAAKTYSALKECKTVTILNTEKVNIEEQPPLLFDLTELQKQANNFFNFSSEYTLEIAQRLYDKKFITYPQTSCCYIPDEVFKEVPNLLGIIDQMKDFSESMPLNYQNNRSVNNEKATSHHAIIITDIVPEYLSKDERLIYNMIITRMVEAFSSVCKKEKKTINARVGKLLFCCHRTVITDKGWRQVTNNSLEDGADSTQLPDFKDEENYSIKSYNLVEVKVKPQPLFTESTLLGAMETAGIGTALTRASIIGNLFRKEYIELSGNYLLPTQKGLYIYQSVKDMKIANVELAGIFEKQLKDIERGKLGTDTFMKSIHAFADDICKEILSIRFDVPGIIKCPKCGGQIKVSRKVVHCMNEHCNFLIFRKFLNKELSEQHIEQLLSSGKTKLIKGFKGKKNKKFDAHITFDEDFNSVLMLPDSQKGKKKGEN